MTSTSYLGCLGRSSKSSDALWPGYIKLNTTTHRFALIDRQVVRTSRLPIWQRLRMKRGRLFAYPLVQACSGFLEEDASYQRRRKPHPLCATLLHVHTHTQGDICLPQLGGRGVMPLLLLTPPTHAQLDIKHRTLMTGRTMDYRTRRLSPFMRFFSTTDTVITDCRKLAMGVSKQPQCLGYIKSEVKGRKRETGR